MSKTSTNKADELQSKVIGFLRFPLIVGVIFIHNISATTVVGGKNLGVATNTPIYNYTSELFSNILGRVSVPMFFLISGFLFFLKVDFDKNIYIKKLKGRINTLLIPYLFWNILFLVFIFAAKYSPGLSSLIGSKNTDLNFFLTSLWGNASDGSSNAMTYPIAYQFWFIRDLMVTVILAPIIRSFVKYTKIYGVIILGVLWYFGWWFGYIGSHGLSIVALFFFSAGAWFSINGKNILEIFGKIDSISFAIYPILVVIDLITKGDPYNIFIHNAGILTGIVFWFNLTANLLKSNKIKIIPFLSSASFFVFAIHEPWLLTSLKKIIFMALNPQSDISMTILYFVLVILVVIFALGIYWIMNRLFPKFTRIISGGR